MQFGKVESLDEINFRLPPDHKDTRLLLSSIKNKKSAPPKIYIGCAKWGIPQWVGRLYPKGTKPKDFLPNYTQHFNSIELNAMFYQLQPEKVIRQWAGMAGDDFRFCPKFSRTITHLRQLRNADESTDKYIIHMQSFGKKLGPSFMQLSDRFAINRAEVIKDYLKKLPVDFRTVLELRHESWFKKDKIAEDLFALLKKQKIGTVITDTAGRRDCLHMRLTAPVAFVRWVGNDLHPTDFKRIDSWAKRIKKWIDLGLREVYFFIHTTNEKYSPELAEYAKEKFKP